MILICANEVAGTTGYHKSIVELANGLHAAGYPVAVVGFLGTGDGAGRMLPLWPLDAGVPAFALHTLAAAGGRLLHRNYHPAFSGSLGSLHYSFTVDQLAALRQLNSTLSADDTVIFTAPVQSLAFKRAIGTDVRGPRTVLQIHGDYLHHVELWDPLIESKGVIDKLQTVADGLRAQFTPTFNDADVVFIPNFPGENGSIVDRVDHEGINIALPASFQHRKNQLDAVRALSLIGDESVHLTLWGNINRRNPYFIAVQQLVDSFGLSERVHFPGFGTEADVYSTADIVLMTSLSEGFPYPLIEAMYQGRPTVSYDFEFGPREAIDDGRSGYIIPLGDIGMLAERLGALAADQSSRAAFGDHAREIFDQRFANEAVADRYRTFLGPAKSSLDIVQAFATDGTEPFAADAIAHRVRHRGVRALHQVIVPATPAIYDAQIDNGQRVEAPNVQRREGATTIEFHADGDEVISYVLTPGSADRHYLANTKGYELQVLPYLRRDARYGDGTPSVVDTIAAASGGTGRLKGRDLTSSIAILMRNAPRDVVWKVRQLSRNARETARPAAAVPDAGDQPAATATPRANDREAIAQAVSAPAARFVSVARLAGAVGKRATNLAVRRLTVKPGLPARREVARHPWFPVTSGVDSFGVPLNRPGGVTVKNDGSALRPTVSVKGEYDWVVLRDAVSERRVEPPFSYGEMFERICDIERDRGLFEITSGGVHVWELGRSALIIQLAEAFGLWGAADAVGASVRDVYDGPKRLTSAPKARRMVFDYARRGQSGYRTAAYRNDETLFVVQPEPTGYPEVDDTNLVYPFHEFNQWRQSARQRWAHLRMPEVDARPFEQALTDALGIRVELGDHLRNRLAKFLAEREFFTPVFERVQPEEVMIASSHWWAGVAAAARRSGALVSDIQYALTSHYAPSFWFGGAPHYGATRLYAWSEYWATRTNVYQEHVIVPRQQADFDASARFDDEEQIWDVCVISQPRVLRRILAFVKDLVDERPELNVVIAPHPAQRVNIAAETSAAGLAGRVAIATEDTLTTIRRSVMCVGTFSTSLWEAAALDRPTYVIPVPGYEETLQDVESGLFRLATSPHDLVPYDVPGSRHAIFGDAP